jgi:ribonucleotide monophosphatase NagD (HAD superfamily)
MNKVGILALGTTLVLGFAMAVQAGTATTGAIGDASCYQIGQPSVKTELGDANCYYQIGQLPSASQQAEAAITDQQAGANTEAQTTAAFRTRLNEPITLNPDWSIPASTYYQASDSAPAVYAGR